MSILFKTFFIIFIIGFVLSISSCGQKETPTNEGTAERAGKKVDHAVKKAGDKMEEGKDAIANKTDEAGEYVSDAYITSKIKAEILSDPLLKSFQISVVTTDNVVKLSGGVDSEQSIRRSLEIANSIKGVKSVENELYIKKTE